MNDCGSQIEKSNNFVCKIVDSAISRQYKISITCRNALLEYNAISMKLNQRFAISLKYQKEYDASAWQ
ncbi:hypothetical protein DBV15_01426 [Temnothorax longispinosus]|uniref:Uncharacterized protein n=1 Tax=Temnothorax longispinosus TaxID=300112 RepID=A0A4S2KZA6_9HYME|nr:hypothetical protein DBV15_01426 [Temnothorax longispinosus]